MKRRRNWPRLAAMLLAVGLLSGSGCVEFTFDDINDLFTVENYSESPDPYLQKVAGVQRVKEDTRVARVERDEYLKDGDPAHLVRAVELRPDDPEYRAHVVINAWSGGDSSAFQEANLELLRVVTLDERRRNSGNEPTEQVIEEKFSEASLGAMALVLAPERAGTIVVPPKNSKDHELYVIYCKRLASHRKAYPVSVFLIYHTLDYGGTCL